MNGEQKEALAKALRLCIFWLVSAVFRTVELETKGFPKATVEKEATGPASIAYCADFGQVGDFLDRGRVSATNLDRLARRVQGLCLKSQHQSPKPLILVAEVLSSCSQTRRMLSQVLGGPS